MCSSTTRAPKFVKAKLFQIKAHTDSQKLRVGYFNMPISPLDKSSIKKLNRPSQIKAKYQQQQKQQQYASKLMATKQLSTE